MSDNTTATLTGRITEPPDAVLREHVLEPQFRYEAEHLLPYYVAAERVLLAEYARLGLLDRAQVAHVDAALSEAADNVTADPYGNLSDIAFAVERRVDPAVAPAWHVDRSRNDLQACAQLMFGRERTLAVLDALLTCAAAAHRLAAGHTGDVMPGHTHLQAAQVITPGFYVSAIAEHLLHTAGRLLDTYDGFDRCPLGAGALAGQELGWDRDRMAALLGFAGPQPHALVAVASRSWLLELAAECSTFAVGLSRPLTDLMAWAGSEYGFVELPDGLAGISSAMPQKKNYPILERLRGRTAHLTSWYLDVAMAQRGTPFSNTVEASKEAGAQLAAATGTLTSILQLLALVLDRLVFRRTHLRNRCTGDYLGGFSLANRLTLDAGIPWRDAQVIAGRYVVAALAAGRAPTDPDPGLLTAAAERGGYRVPGAEAMLRAAFDPELELRRRRSPGSAHPDEVAELLAVQGERHARLSAALAARRAALDGVPDRIDAALSGGGAR